MVAPLLNLRCVDGRGAHSQKGFLARAVSTALIALPLLTGCSGDSRTDSFKAPIASSSSAAAPRPNGRPVAVRDSRAAAVTEGYLDYWETFQMLGADPGDSDQLKAVAVDPELSRGIDALKGFESQKQRLRGFYRNQPRVTALAKTEATVSDCLVVGVTVVGADASSQTPPPPPQPVKADLELVGLVWKVANVSPDPSSVCVPKRDKKTASK